MFKKNGFETPGMAGIKCTRMGKESLDFLLRSTGLPVEIQWKFNEDLVQWTKFEMNSKPKTLILFGEESIQSMIFLARPGPGGALIKSWPEENLFLFLFIYCAGQDL